VVSGRRRLWLMFTGGLLALVVALGIAAHRAKSWLEAPIVALTTPTTFEIERGSSLRVVASDLERARLLDHPRLFTAWARLTDRETGIKAGEYRLMPGSSPIDLLELFHSGKVLLHEVTFIEGMTIAEMRAVLASHSAVRSTPEASDDARLMSALGAAGEAAEGRFFPDTYHFPRNTTDREILEMAFERMESELQRAWENRADDLPLASKYEALILASIIEKETGLDSERAVIGGVFVSRLRLGMRLQSDPTVIYGLGDAFDGDLRRVDLRTDTPYNTYTRSGLPPTPIAAPGAASLGAAVQPQVTGALYFVATGNGDGSHYFSKTLPEHEAAVRRYLRKLREQR
jgi:UPF0755 protein